MQTLKTGIAGCGKVAHYHARALSKLKQSGFRAVMSRSEENG